MHYRYITFLFGKARRCLAALIAAGPFRRRAALLVGLLVGLLVVLAADAHAESDSIWHRLASPSAVTWEAQELRSGLRDYGATVGIDIWLDRRINPNRAVSVACKGTVLDVLQQLAKRVDGRAICNGQFVMIGIPVSLERAVANIYRQRINLQASRTPAPAAGLLRQRPFRFSVLTTPDDALRQANQMWQVPWEAESLPHDLWPETEFHASDYPTIANTLLAGFDLAVTFEGGRPDLVPLESVDPRYGQSYGPSTLSRGAEQQLKRIDPASHIERLPNKLVITTTAVAHQFLHVDRAQFQAPERDETPAPRFDLRVINKPARVVLETLATNLNANLVVAEQADRQIDQNVSVEVKQQTLLEIARQVSREAGLIATLAEGELRIEVQREP